MKLDKNFDPRINNPFPPGTLVKWIPGTNTFGLDAEVLKKHVFLVCRSEKRFLAIYYGEWCFAFEVNRDIAKELLGLDSVDLLLHRTAFHLWGQFSSFEKVSSGEEESWEKTSKIFLESL